MTRFNFYFSLYTPLPGYLMSLPLTQLWRQPDPISCFWGWGVGVGDNSHWPSRRPGDCTFRAYKPALGLGPIPHSTSWVWLGHGLWAALNTPGDPEPVDKSHHLHPHCSGLGKEGDRKHAKASEVPATDQGLPGEGKEPGG